MHSSTISESSLIDYLTRSEANHKKPVLDWSIILKSTSIVQSNMSGKVVLVCLFGVLASAAAQVCGGLVQPVYSNVGLSSGSCGLSSGSIGFPGNTGLNYGSVNSLGGPGLGYSSQLLEPLSIAAGSSYGPGGISVLADNLEITGQVGVSGSYPVLGVISFGGNVPTGGQGQVTYSTGSGVSLGASGCGYGQPTAQPTISGNFGVSGVNAISTLNGVSGVNSLNLNGFSNNGCSCGSNIF